MKEREVEFDLSAKFDQNQKIKLQEKVQVDHKTMKKDPTKKVIEDIKSQATETRAGGTKDFWVWGDTEWKV